MLDDRGIESASIMSPLSIPEYQYLVQNREDNLRSILNPLEPMIMRIQSVLVWERPRISVAMLLFVNFMFWLATTTSLRFYYLLAMAVLVVIFLETWKNRIWPEIRVPTPDDEDSEGWTPVHPRLLSVPELAHLVAEYWTTLTYYSNAFWDLRRTKPRKFCLYVCSGCLLLAIVGTYVTGIMISYITVMSLLLWPCMYYHNFLKKFYIKFEPLLMQLHYSMKIKRKRAHQKKPTPPEDEDKDRVETDTDSDIESFVPSDDPEATAALARAITDSEDEGSPCPSPMERSVEREMPVVDDIHDDDLSDLEDFTAGLNGLPSFTDTRLDETDPSLADLVGQLEPGDRVGDANETPPPEVEEDTVTESVSTPTAEGTDESMKFVSTHFKQDSDSSDNGDDTLGEGALSEGLDFGKFDESEEAEETSKDASAVVMAAVAGQVMSQTLSNVVSGTLSGLARLTETVRVPSSTPTITEIDDNTQNNNAGTLRRSLSHSDSDLGDFEVLDKNELDAMQDDTQ
ncbi:reticulophagy regulator 3-like [Lineus longissimus]|uniref:reticulophagy regulator 3-like n=1 Tax=Lineus longissimus TaxID=88925 RepID=UPI002B4C7398